VIIVLLVTSSTKNG